MRLVLDTNILIDALAQREPFAADARKVLALGYVHEFDIWVSAGSMKDLLYVLSNGGSRSKTSTALASLERLEDFVHICSLTEEDFVEVTRCTWPDPEDFLIELAARKTKADAIITRNSKDFEKSSFRVFDCNQFFRYLSDVRRLAFDVVSL